MYINLYIIDQIKKSALHKKEPDFYDYNRDM